MDSLKSLCREIIRGISARGIRDQDKLNRLKLELLKKYPAVKDIPTNVDLAACACDSERKKYRHLLTIKPTRTLSGVAVVAIMTKLFPCPHGKCIMCPGGINSPFGDMPQSYTGKEPATRRAIRNKYDPYLQVWNRLEQYVAMNKVPEKIELILMGGTFPSFPKKYQEEFVMYSFKALNDFSKIFFRKDKLLFGNFCKFFELPFNVDDDSRTRRVISKILKLKKKGARDLSVNQSTNEVAKIRCVGLTIETRADYALLKHANEMLRLGTTRVELGVQSVYDSALKRIERGHGAEDNKRAISILKDLGFKINIHYMPGLPGIAFKKDLDGMISLFTDPSYKPDMLKIYPCMVIKGTKLYSIWKQGRFSPLTTKKAARLIAEFKQHVPPYCRIMRVQRDIPSEVISAGVDRTNLRQYVAEEMKKKKIVCRCIRCREIGRFTGKLKEPSLQVIHYEASGGIEFFLAVQYCGFILGFCRMRFPAVSLRKEITSDSALIRELHVYGEAVEIGKSGDIQHKGYGKRLLEEAESIAKDYNRDKMVVISGIGVREYYQKLGYKKEGPYMVKDL